MKLVGSKEKGYKLESSFAKPVKKPKNDTTNQTDADLKDSAKDNK